MTIKNDNDGRGGGLPGLSLHEEFRELCAISTTGELTGLELARLKEHLAACPKCREALEELKAAAHIGAPLLVSVLAASGQPAESSDAEKGVAQSEYGSEEAMERGEIETACSRIEFAPGDRNSSAQVSWNNVWLTLATAVLMTVALGFYAYKAEIRQVVPTAQVPAAGDTDKIDSFEQQLSDAAHEREVLKKELSERDEHVAELEKQIAAQTSALNSAENAQSALTRSLHDAVDDKQRLVQLEASTSQNLALAEASLAKMQSELEYTRQQQGEGEIRSADLQSRIGDLETALIASQRENAKEQNRLTEDADIRDLIGARDLYIAEIYDVGRDGATQKPYGRVFYTKGKSLIFYAYDLDQQPGAKGATTFQAWGQNGPDRQQALNLGLFYEDNVAKKRWIVKFDDARALEHINAVFVTVEPNGGSQKPSGKPLLFASLKIEPNHP